MHNEKVHKLVVSKWCSLSPDKDSDEQKTFNIELTIDDVTVKDMALGLLKGEVIRWQNANRRRYDKLIDRSTHKIVFKRPIAEVDPEQAMVEKLRSMTDEERATYLAEMMAKVSE